MSVRLAFGLVLFAAFGFATSAVAQSADSSTAEPRARQVYVPLEDLDQVIDRDQRGVILSRDEYAKLSALAQKQRETYPQTTHPIAASKAEYSAEIVDDQLVLTALIELTQLRPGWQTLTLPFRNVAIERATLDDKPAQLGRAGADRTLVLFSAAAGRHTLSLKLSTSLVSLGSDRVAAFGLAPIPVAQLQLSLPAGQFLHADESPLERPAATDQPARYALAVGGRRALNLRLAGKQALQQSASLVFASTAMGLAVADEEQTWRAVSTLNVFGKPVDSLQFVIPKTLDIVSVESTGLERWEIAAGPSDITTALRLIYRQPVSDTRAVVFQGVSTGGLEKPWSVPTLGLTGAASHSVHVVMRQGAGLRLQPVAANGVRRITAEEAATTSEPPTNDATPGESAQTLHYAAWREDFTLQFVTRPRSRELQATIATRVDIDAQEIGLRSSISVQSRFAPLFDLDLALPVDWSVVDVLIGDQSARWRVVPVDAGSNQIRISFQPPIPAEGKAALTLIARRIPGERWPIESEPFELPLPEVHLPQVGVTDGRYMVAADNDLELSIDEMTGLEPVRLSNREQKLARAPRLVYEYQDTRFQGNLRVSRRPLRLTAQTLAFHRLDRESIVSHLEARLVIQGGGLQKLDVALPEAAGADLRFQTIDRSNGNGPAPPEIIEQTSAPPAGGERVWTLRFDRRVFGLLWLVVPLQSPRTADAKEFAFPALRVVRAERQSGQIAVEAGPDQLLKLSALDAAGHPLAEVDPADVSVPAGFRPHDRIVAAYQAVRAGYRISASETRFERQPVPTAICDKATLTSVVSQAGEIQHQAEFYMRATGVQSLRIELPADAGLWATLVDGQPMEARAAPADEGAPAAHLVPLPPVAQPTAVRNLRLFYRTSAGRLQDSGALRQTPPRLSVVSGQGETQPLEILERDWVLYHPDGTDITSSKGQFEPVDRPARSSLLGELQEGLQLESARDMAFKGLAVLAAGAVIGALWLSFRRRGLSGLATTAVVGGILAVLATLILPATQSAREAAQRTQMKHDQMQAEMAMAQAKAPAAGEAPPARLPAQATPQEEPASENENGNFAGATRQVINPENYPGYGSIVGLQPNKKPGAAGGRQVPHLEGQILPPNLPQEQQGEFGVAIAHRRPDAAPDDAPPQANPAGGAQQQAIAPEKHGALLSLAINLQPDADSRATKFHYTGVSSSGAEPVLEVELQNRHLLSVTGLAWQAGILLLFWFARHWSPGVRATLAIVGLVGPLALLPLVPLKSLTYLDALFVGTIWGLLLWGLLVMADGCRRGVCPWSKSAQPMLTTTATFLVAGTLIFTVMEARAAGDIRAASQAERSGQTGGTADPAAGSRSDKNRHQAAATVSAGLSSSASSESASTKHGSTDSPFYAASNAPVQVAFADPPPINPTPNSELRAPNAPPISLHPTTAANPLQSDRILLPFDEFLRMRRAAYPERELDRHAPRDGIVAEALYAAEVAPASPGAKPSVAVTGRFSVHNFRDEQVTLPLPLGRVSLRTATLNGKAAPIVSRDGETGPELSIVLPERGAYVVDVTFSLPAEQAGPSGQFVLPLRPVPTGALRFTLPAADQTLKVTGPSGAFRRVREGEKTIAIVPIDDGGEIGLAWSPPQAREAVDEIVQALSITSLTIEDAGLRLEAHVKFTVRQGTVSEANFALPAGLLVRRITGLDLGGWEITGDGDRRSLTVFLRRPVSDETALDFDLFQLHAITDQPQPIPIPQFAPQGIARESGLLGVFVANHLSVISGASAGVTQIDAVQFVHPHREGASANARGVTAHRAPTPVPQLAYRFAARPFQLSLQAARQKPVSKGVAEHACHVGLHKLRLVSRLEAQVVGAPRSEIAIQLPAGYLLYDLKSPAVADYFVEAGADGQPPVLHVDLTTPRTGAIELLLDGTLPRATDDSLTLVAVPFPLGFGDLRSSLAIWLDRSFSATYEELEGWKSIDPGQLPDRLRAARQAPAQLAFASSQTAVPPLVLDLARAASRLSAQALTVVMVRDTSVQYALYLRWHIALAGESSFVFTTPAWMADRLDIERMLPGVRIRQVSSEPIEQNHLRWMVTLEAPRETVLLLSAQAALPPPESGRIEAPRVTFERLVADDEGERYTPLDNQEQHLLLINQAPRRLDRDAPDGSVQPIPARELPIRIGAEISNQAAEILAVKNPAAAIGWQVQPAATLKSLPASVNVARMTLVVAHDGSWRVQADYRVNNRARQFLAVRLPPKSHVLSLFVAQQAARPIRPDRPNDPDVLLVPLPKTALGELSAEVRLVFEGRLDRPLPRGVQVLRSEIDLPAPQVLSQNEDPEFGAPVAATEWTVILPEDMDAARIDDPTRSNVAASAEGAEPLIATYQELLSLVAVASEAKVRNDLRQLGRAESNLKQLGRRVTVDNSLNMADGGERQARQLTELQQKWLAAQREIETFRGRIGSEGGATTGASEPLSQKLVQREIFANNAADLAAAPTSADDDGFRFEVAPPEERRTAEAKMKGDKDLDRQPPATKNRAALKVETAAQAIDLNANIAGHPQAGTKLEIESTDRPSSSTPPQPAGQPPLAESPFLHTDDVDEFFDHERFDEAPGAGVVAGKKASPANERRSRDAARARRSGAKMAGVPILSKPSYVGRIFGMQQDFEALARGEARDVDNVADGVTDWTETGGLSLAIDIPQAGKKQTFSKSGGDARLALGLRPRASLESGLGLAWTVVWLIVALGSIAALGRHDALHVLLRRAPLGLAILGLLWCFLLPAATYGFMVFVAGLSGLAWQHRRG